MPPPLIDSKAIFLNIPYDLDFRSLYVAYIVGLCHLGFVPHLASEIPGGSRRLERILDLIRGCRFSIHDLSRIELSAGPEAVPRFNLKVHRFVEGCIDPILEKNGTDNIYSPSVFGELCKLSTRLAGLYRYRPGL